MNRSRSITLVSSLLVVIGYVTLAGLAFAHFHLRYSPTQNWLSDLGNPDVSPTGAIFYNAGVAISSGLVLVFFLSLFSLRLPNNRAQNAMTILTVLFGGAGALGMLMSSLHPINQPAAHSFWCMILFISLGSAFAFSVAMFRYHAWYPRWLLVFGAVVALVTLVSQTFFAEVQVLEWIIVTLFLSYCVLIGIATQRLQGRTGPLAAQ
jgi:hypothetical membrane protein